MPSNSAPLNIPEGTFSWVGTPSPEQVHARWAGDPDYEHTRRLHGDAWAVIAFGAQVEQILPPEEPADGQR